MFWVLRQLRFLGQLRRGEVTHHQLALALTAGVIVGMVPKGNLLAVLLTMAFLSLRISIPHFMVTVIGVSLIAGWLDPLTHRVGLALLSAEPMRPLWQGLYRLPLAPWTAFNNTVVFGSLTVSLSGSLPTYLLCRRWLSRRERLASGRPSAGTGEAAAVEPEAGHGATATVSPSPAPELVTEAAEPSVAAAALRGSPMARGESAERRPRFDPRRWWHSLAVKVGRGPSADSWNVSMGPPQPRTPFPIEEAVADLPEHDEKVQESQRHDDTMWTQPAPPQTRVLLRLPQVQVGRVPQGQTAAPRAFVDPQSGRGIEERAA